MSGMLLHQSVKLLLVMWVTLVPSMFSWGTRTLEDGTTYTMNHVDLTMVTQVLGTALTCVFSYIAAYDMEITERKQFHWGNEVRTCMLIRLVALAMGRVPWGCVRIENRKNQ